MNSEGFLIKLVTGSEANFLSNFCILGDDLEGGEEFVEFSILQALGESA